MCKISISELIFNSPIPYVRKTLNRSHISLSFTLTQITQFRKKKVPHKKQRKNRNRYKKNGNISICPGRDFTQKTDVGLERFLLQ